MMGPRIVVVGSVNVDLVTRADRLPKPGETLHGSAFSMTLGGKGANQAVAAARLGARVMLVGALGDDAFGDWARRELARESTIQLNGVATIAGTSTGIASISIDSTGQNAITIVAGANGAVSPAAVELSRAEIAGADVLMLQGEIGAHANIAAARIAREAGVTVVLDPAPVPSGGFPDELLGLADVITPNESEAQALTGIDVTDRASARAAAERLLARGVATVVVKMGGAGAIAATAAGEFIDVLPFKVTVVDTVAAGDSFNAGLACGLGQRIGLENALRLASASGALATTRAGASAAAPDQNEVAALIRRGE